MLQLLSARLEELPPDREEPPVRVFSAFTDVGMEEFDMASLGGRHAQ
jgi:hypothetical protein